MLSAFANALRTPDLRKKILFTLFILALFRLGSTIPTPNVNMENVNQCQVIASQGDTAGLYSMINLFSGGALLRMTILALGIMPYITASIILQLLTVVIPRLDALKKEGASGTAKITQYTRYLTLVLAVLNSTAFVTLAYSGQLFQGCSLDLVYDKSLFPMIVMILTMTAGTGLIMWMGELITDRGVGNGMSVMIFTQVCAQFPAELWAIKQTQSSPAAGWTVFIIVLIIGFAVMAAVVYMEQAQRRIPVQYAKRMVGRRLVGGTTTYIPMKVNQAGVIPVIFASSLLYLPVLYAQFQPGTANAPNPVSSWIAANLMSQTGNNSWVYDIIYGLLIIAFAYFYVNITFNPEEVSDNMKKYGGFIPGTRAGSPTARYLSYVLSRLTFPGALYLAIVALIPQIAYVFLPGVQQKFPFGGTSILIIVGVGLDTVKQIQSQLQQRNYEGFLR